MRIVSVMSATASGGAEIAAIELLDALTGRGHECVMLSDLEDIGRDTGVRVVPVQIGPRRSTRSWPSLPFGWLGHTRRLRRALEAQAPYDVLLVHGEKEQLMARHLPRPLRPTLAWAAWGPVPMRLRRGLPRRRYLAAARRADIVLAIAQHTKDSVCDVGVPDAKVVVVPTVLRVDDIQFTAEGRRTVRARLGIPEDAFVVGCVSRLDQDKRNDVAVDAVAAMDPGTHLILAGTGAKEDELRVRGATMGERFHLVPTPQGDIADVLSACDVTVFCPSPTDGQPRAVILGMLTRRPVLSTGAEGVADMIFAQFGAITSPEHDPASLIPVLEHYRDDPAARERAGEAARRAAESTYAAPVVAEQVEGLLADLPPR